MRKPAVAGQFYPRDRDELKKQISKFLKKENKNRKIAAAIVPHAGYFFSGKAAGKVYSVLPSCETFVILGTNHTGRGQGISISPENFETPIGTINNDAELGKQILKNLNLNEDTMAHEFEHSIEVQLPFLQQIQKTEQKQENFKIVPILLSFTDLETCRKIAKAVCDSAKRLKRKIIVLASSDFTHSGPSYGANISPNFDKEAIKNILILNSERFFSIASRTTICGTSAICTVIEFSKIINAKRAKLLSYYTSSDILPGKNWVGYAGIIFIKS